MIKVNIGLIVKFLKIINLSRMKMLPPRILYAEHEALHLGDVKLFCSLIVPIALR